MKIIKDYKSDNFLNKYPDYLPLLEKSKILKYEKNEIILRQWEEDNGFAYVIASGDVTIHRDWNKYAKLTTGKMFWELSHLVNEIRSASVIANTQVIVFQFSKNTLLDFLRDPKNISLRSGILDKILSNFYDIKE